MSMANALGARLGKSPVPCGRGMGPLGRSRKVARITATTGSIQVPAGAKWCRVKMWGAGGLISDDNWPGGAGGYTYAEFAVVSGEVLRTFVGSSGNGTTGGSPGGGNGSSNGHCSGGGGYTGVFRDTVPLAIAGAGGGAGGGSGFDTNRGGNGGGLSGYAAQGSGSPGAQGSGYGYLQGGNGSSGSFSGGGGGGYWGGGGGNSYGGAGGSGYVGPMCSAASFTERGEPQYAGLPGNALDPDRGTAGNPGVAGKMIMEFWS